MDRKRSPDEMTSTASQPAAASVRAPRAAANPLADLLAPRADATWQASSFDLAQGLDVKVMESKLSREMLDELFRRA